MKQYKHLQGLRKIKYKDLGLRTLEVKRVIKSWEHGEYVYSEIETDYGIYKISVDRRDFWTFIYIKSKPFNCQLRYTNWFKTQSYDLKKYWGIG